MQCNFPNQNFTITNSSFNNSGIAKGEPGRVEDFPILCPATRLIYSNKTIKYFIIIKAVDSRGPDWAYLPTSLI